MGGEILTIREVAELLKINEKTGKLTPTTQAKVNTGGGTAPLTLAASPGGNFLYVLDPGLNQIFQFSIDKTNGALKQIGGGPRFATRAARYFSSASPYAPCLHRMSPRSASPAPAAWRSPIERARSIAA